jgi:hypothetical protein
MNPLVAKATKFYTVVPNILISSLGSNPEHVDYGISLFIFGSQWLQKFGERSQFRKDRGWWQHSTSK